MAGLASAGSGLIRTRGKKAEKAVDEVVVDDIEIEEGVEPVVPARKNSKSLGTTKIDTLASEFTEEIPEEVWGSHSGYLAYVTALGDPSERDNATFRSGGKSVTENFSRIVGYRFKVLHDTKVPDFGATERFYGSRLMSAKDVTNWKDVKVGDIVDLTRVEVMALMVQPEYNQEITGGENAVRLQIRFATLDKMDPQSAEDLPHVNLSLAKGHPTASSIKELGIIDVLDYTPSSEQFASGVHKLRPEFEGTAFAMRAMDRTKRPITRGSGRGKTTVPGGQNRQSTKAASQLLTRLAAAQNKG